MYGYCHLEIINIFFHCNHLVADGVSTCCILIWAYSIAAPWSLGVGRVWKGYSTLWTAFRLGRTHNFHCPSRWLLLVGLFRSKFLLVARPPLLTGCYANIHRKNEIDNWLVSTFKHCIKITSGQYLYKPLDDECKREKMCLDLGDLVWLEIHKRMFQTFQGTYTILKCIINFRIQSNLHQ